MLVSDDDVSCHGDLQTVTSTSTSLHSILHSAIILHHLRCCPQGQCEMNVLEKMLCVMFLFANHCGGSMSVQVVGR